MISKNEIRCVRTLKRGPFFTEYLVCFDYDGRDKNYMRLRSMPKAQIVTNKIDEEMVVYELYIRSNIRHPFLVNQLCAFQDYNTLFYITEYAPLPLLTSCLLPKKFPLKAVQLYGAEILLCLRYLHSKNQIYTFLSPRNIFLDASGHIKLDYSFCNSLNETKCEVLENIEYASLDFLTTGDFSRAGDYWSLGIVLYKMAFGYSPFGLETFDETLSAMQQLDFEFPDNADPDLTDFIKLLFNISHTEGWLSRLEDADILMEHAFFAGIDWNKLLDKDIEPPFIPKIECTSAEIHSAPQLSTLYTGDFIVGDKDGYGQTFSHYNTVNYLKM
ncbi:hypothetical protein PAEPH01_1538 [Pancytospora epiphaga]|nr:hypothetical protein PAEPH01_1538 [Pancytospora epiphaga]